jgi:5,5'-dehydrodivanillate O-demethylase
MAAKKKKAKPRSRRAARKDYTDFAHTAPETLAGRFLRGFWQPIYLARDIKPGFAKPVHIMNDRFTLYRGHGGKPHLVDFRCPHRGEQLSVGWVVEDNIQCFYHGWAFDGAGQCVDQPAEPKPFCRKVKINSYPTEEYLGLIFAYFGEGTAPPLPRYPHFEGEGVLQVDTYTRDCNYFNNLDNDPVHVYFVHRNSPFDRAGLDTLPNRLWAEECSFGASFYTQMPGRPVRSVQRGMPNIIHFKGSPNPVNGAWTDHLSWRVPVDDETHASFNINLVHVTGEAAEKYRRHQADDAAKKMRVRELAQAVLRGELRIADIDESDVNIVNVQDEVSQAGQGVIADRSNERLGHTDRPVILFRKLWERELKALAEGKPLRQWHWTEELVATSGVA